MADKKITELTAIGTPAVEDLLVVVDDPSGTPETKKATITQVADVLKARTETLTNKTLSTGCELDTNAGDNFTYHSMARQAIINGNFDVWQRGTTTTLTDTENEFLADRWGDSVVDDGGTLPTLTRSRVAFTAGTLYGSYYYTKLATNGAGTSLGNNSYFYMYQKIEHGTRLLCGNGKTVTLSYWAKSDIANKKICPTLIQNYGTGGSPTTQEPILGEPITLTSTWTEYTVTFTTNTLTGKTFGTANDDYLTVLFWHQWGSTIGNTYVKASVAAETYVGSGEIDIAQVQLCAGDVALPFQPKSYENELKACQRYCYVPKGDGIYSPYAMSGVGTAGNGAYVLVQFPVEMCKPPELTATADEYWIWDGTTSVNVTSLAMYANTPSKTACVLSIGTGGSTQYRFYALLCDGTANRLMIFSAEL